jgi:type I restriction enzyme S subunit
VEEVCSAIIDRPHSTPKWSDSGEICLRTTNFRLGFLDLSEVRYVSPKVYQERTVRLEPHPGDVVYSREGGILGIACIIPPDTKVCLGQRMMLMRTANEIYLPTLLMHVLNLPLILARVQELTGGTASPHLNVADIKAFPVPLPPLEEQCEIVRRVEALFKLVDAIERRVAAATVRAEKLTQAILAKAFRGELVPTEAELARREGRSYEPASALLALIKAERESI